MTLVTDSSYETQTYSYLYIMLVTIAVFVITVRCNKLQNCVLINVGVIVHNKLHCNVTDSTASNS